MHGGCVAIGGDDAEVPDGRGTAEDVHHQPDAAGDPTEHPVAETLVGGGERQDSDGEQKVTGSQVADQTVGDGTEGAVAEQRDEHQQVAERGEDDERRQCDG